MPARKRFLLVNDDQDSLFLLGRSVSRAFPDAEVALFASAVKALVYLEKHSVDAVVTDNGMPEMDGITFVRTLRQQHGRTPVLMVTNSNHLGREASEAGVTLYLPCARWSEIGESLRSLVAS